MSRYTIYTGDCIEVMKTLESESVDCVVTSPPYWGLRDYGVDGQYGLEATPDEYVAQLVRAFQEVWRVLKDSGTVWLNLGDSYCSSSPSGGNNTSPEWQRPSRGAQPEMAKRSDNLRPKNLVGIPWKVAFALQAEGYILRQDIIWFKSNGMPESVRDRCTKSHEYIFLLSKKPRYYYDADAIKTPLQDSSVQRLLQDIESQNGSERVSGKTNGAMKALNVKGEEIGSGLVNKRSVWHIATQSFKEAHYAVMAPEVARLCIRAGCPKDGVVLDPFGGAGTTGLVAMQEGRDSVMIELNPENVELMRKRLDEHRTMFDEEVAVESLRE